MSDIGNLPNIGRALEEKLKQAGITSREELTKVGSKNAFLRIKSMDESACLNMLYALEGAMQGIRWHYLSEEDKNDLKKFFESQMLI
jgi:DNA transformation protein